MNSLSRWWQGRGFGIQSKTDYEYLKDVLKETLPYYAYEEIRGESARLIYRICLHEQAKGRRVTLTGKFSNEEIAAANRAMTCAYQKLTHLHGQDTVIIGGIHSDCDEAEQLWQQALKSKAVTWDIRNFGVVRFLKGRYAEHYAI
jgi:hypothetical protein